MSSSSDKVSTNQNPDLDFVKTLPQEITIDILSRLPIQTLVACKLVSRPWRNLLESLDFATSHLSKSVPLLFVFHGKQSPTPYKMFEFVYEPNRRKKEKAALPFTASPPFPRTGPVLGSVDGLLIMCDGDDPSTRRLYACNPMTREYIKLPPPPKLRIKLFTAGVGASKAGGGGGGRCKVVRICKTSAVDGFECHVHTLGTDSWRTFPAGAPGLKYRVESLGAFVNGNLHWLVNDSNGNEWISCFDLENETFSLSASPSPTASISKTLSAVEGRLCLCEDHWDALDVWFMKECGDEKSWSKELQIDEAYRSKWYRTLSGFVSPIKVLEDGDVLFAVKGDEQIFWYSKETGEVRSTGIRVVTREVVVYTPSFVPLRRFLEGNSVFLSDDFGVELF